MDSECQTRGRIDYTFDLMSRVARAASQIGLSSSNRQVTLVGERGDVVETIAELVRGYGVSAEEKIVSRGEQNLDMPGSNVVYIERYVPKLTHARPSQSYLWHVRRAA